MPYSFYIEKIIYLGKIIERAELMAQLIIYIQKPCTCIQNKSGRLCYRTKVKQYISHPGISEQNYSFLYDTLLYLAGNLSFIKKQYKDSCTRLLVLLIMFDQTLSIIKSLSVVKKGAVVARLKITPEESVESDKSLIFTDIRVQLNTCR